MSSINDYYNVFYDEWGRLDRHRLELFLLILPIYSRFSLNFGSRNCELLHRRAWDCLLKAH